MVAFKKSRRVTSSLGAARGYSYGSGSSPARGRKPTGTIIFLVLLLLAGGFFLLRWQQGNLQIDLEGMSAGRQPVSTGFSHSGVKTYSTASEVLETLSVAQPSSGSHYQRSAFGEAWEDIDGNGCDQRNDILARDLTDLKVAKNCKVLSGLLTDPYTLETINFRRGQATSDSVPIDHVVALSNAWSSGAWQWTREERTLLANDPLNLQATGRLSNDAKSNKDAASWLPQAGYRCEYVARQISIKAAYKLSVTPAEKKAMQGVLGACPDQPAYRSAFMGN